MRQGIGAGGWWNGIRVSERVWVRVHNGALDIDLLYVIHSIHQGEGATPPLIKVQTWSNVDQRTNVPSAPGSPRAFVWMRWIIR